MDQIILQNSSCFFIQQKEAILVGSGLIIPKWHLEAPFDLKDKEWTDTFSLLQYVIAWMKRHYSPDGYNIGWNCGVAAGQEVKHSHMHVIPRFKDEPMAGKGIRYHLKQETNKRSSQ